MYKHICYVTCLCVVDVCYVPVYRSVDNSVPPVLGTPCSLEDCHSPSKDSLSQSPVKLSLVGRAFAGPMSPAKVCPSVVVCVYICVRVRTCVCLCVRACVCVCVCICVHVYHVAKYISICTQL